MPAADEAAVQSGPAVLEYAEFMGLDIAAESHLLWIAAAAVQACAEPLKDGWTEQVHGEDLYYFNTQTGESSWDHPCDEKYRQLLETERLKPKQGYIRPDDSASKDGLSQRSSLRSVETRRSSFQSMHPLRGHSRSASKTTFASLRPGTSWILQGCESKGNRFRLLEHRNCAL